MKIERCYIEWDDSASVPTGWEEIEQVIRDQKEPLKCHTVAWLLNETPKMLTLCMSYTIGNITGEPYMADRVFTIPTSAVTLMERWTERSE